MESYILILVEKKALKDIMQEQGQKTKLGQEIRLADIDIDQSEYGIFDRLDFAEDGAKQSIELAKRLNQSYGVAGIAWLEYITSHKDQVIKQAEQLLDQYREALSSPSYARSHCTSRQLFCPCCRCR